MRPQFAFGEVLRTLRNSKGMSQEALAFDTDLDRTYISMLERGLRQPTLTTMLQISKALGISSTNLMAMVEEKLTIKKR